jgi:type IV secretion system protein VirB10
MNSEHRAIEPTINENDGLGAESFGEASDDSLNSEGIVSVNQHGRQGSNTAAKIGFVTICVAIVLAVGLTFWNKHRIASSKEMENSKAAAKVENKPAAIGKPREFTEVAPAPAVVEVKTADGGVVKVDTQGYMVPDTVSGPLDGNAKPIGISGQKQTGSTGGAANGGQSAPDRYSGDIMVSSGRIGGVAAAAPPTSNTAESYARVLSKVLDRSGGGGNATLATPRDSDEQKEEPHSEMDSRLATNKVETVSAMRMSDRSMILPKGKSIDCTLTSRIISELPGYVTCVLQNNVYSDDGRVVLLEKGSEATGEFGNTVVQGQHRLFVLWDRIKTPTGVLISLNSPGTDALGTSGVPGFVDNRWFERIGSAFLLSFLKDAIAYKLNENSSNGGNNGNSTYAFQGSMETGNKMAEKVLDSTINLKPVLYANQGDTLAIFVARDLDFASVYKLTLR